MERKLILALIPCFFLPLLFVSPVEATTETLYMQYNTWLRNGLWAYAINTTALGASYRSVTTGIYDGSVYVTQYFGIRVWYRTSGGVETEITSGTPVAIASGSTSGIVSATWSCPSTTISTTDNILVKVYANDVNPPSAFKGNFTSDVLGTTILNANTWTLYYYLYRAYSGGSKLTTYYFRWGSTTYNSRIEGFKYGEAGGATEYTYTLSQTFAVSASNTEGKEKRFTGSNTVVVDSASWLGKEILLGNSESVASSWQMSLGRAFGFGLSEVTATVSSSTRGIESLFTPTQTATISASVIISLERTLTEWAFTEVVQITDSIGLILEGVAEEVFLFFELWMDVLWIPLVASPFLLALWFSRRREEDD